MNVRTSSRLVGLLHRSLHLRHTVIGNQYLAPASLLHSITTSNQHLRIYSSNRRWLTQPTDPHANKISTLLTQDESQQKQATTQEGISVKINLNAQDIQDIVDHSSAVRLRLHLEYMQRQALTIEEYMDLCKAHGMDSQSAAKLLDHMNQAGVVLHLPNAATPELRNMVHLQPEQLLSPVSKSMSSAFEYRVKSELKALEDQIAPEKAKLDHMDKRSSRRATRLLYTGLFAIFGQTVLYAYLVWWQLAWDIMEPICYFTSQTIVIGSYIYFMRAGTDHSYSDMWTRLKTRYEKKLMRKAGLDTPAVSRITSRIQDYREFLRINSEGRNSLLKPAALATEAEKYDPFSQESRKYYY